MAANPYETLGVKQDATQEDIRAAYRKLAKKLHPDLNPGDRSSEERFKAVSSAYDLLADPDKRARFDRGEIDASGVERPAERYYRDFQDVGGHSYDGASGYADMDDLLSGLFGEGVGEFRSQFRMRGQDVPYRLAVDFLEAVNGATKRIGLPGGGMIDVTIPPGTRDGQALRLRGKGLPGSGGGQQGDAIVSIEVRPHPFFTRNGDDIDIELPITLREAVLGAKVEVPTPAGRVVMSVPKGANTGTRLRLKGKGVARPGGGRGDAYAVLKVVLPERPDRELETFVQGWTAGEKHNPRARLEAAA
ncbi:MAG: J domain-containing protein [Rhizobiales bacterium]|nr:J domain-containing protein [Hyphomicrobiales bacterium]